VALRAVVPEQQVRRIRPLADFPAQVVLVALLALLEELVEWVPPVEVPQGVKADHRVLPAVFPAHRTVRVDSPVLQEDHPEQAAARPALPRAPPVPVDQTLLPADSPVLLVRADHQGDPVAMDKVDSQVRHQALPARTVRVDSPVPLPAHRVPTDKVDSRVRRQALPAPMVRAVSQVRHRALRVPALRTGLPEHPVLQAVKVDHQDDQAGMDRVGSRERHQVHRAAMARVAKEAFQALLPEVLGDLRVVPALRMGPPADSLARRADKADHLGDPAGMDKVAFQARQVVADQVAVDQVAKVASPALRVVDHRMVPGAPALLETRAMKRRARLFNNSLKRCWQAKTPT
jgi:hypothetical protein